MLAKAFGYLKVGFTIVAIGCLAWVFTQTDVARAVDLKQVNAGWFVVALLSLAVAHLLSPLAAGSGLRAVGHDLPYHFLLRSHLLRLPARYIPGGVWHSVGRAFDFSQRGVAPSALTSFLLLENGLAAASALLLGLCLIAIAGGQPQGQVLILTMSGLVLAGTLAVPWLWNFLAPRHRAARWNLPAYYQAGGRFLLVWCAYASAFVSYFYAVAGSATEPFMTVAGAYLVSWAVGLFAVFAPQGVGVFEYVFSRVLGGSNVLEIIALAAGFRLCMLLADTACWMVALIGSALAKNEYESGRERS